MANPERRLDLGLVVEHRGHQVEAAQQINRVIFHGEDHRLLFGKREFPRGRIIGEVIRSGLVREPLAQIALAGADRQKKSDARQYRPELLQWSRKFLADRRFASALNRVGHVI